MSLLRQSLGHRQADDPLWMSHAAWQSAGHVRTLADSLAAQLPQGGRIALAFNDDASLATAMIAASGRCACALLVPSSWDQKQLNRYLPDAAISLLVTDRTDITAASVLRPLSTPSSTPEVPHAATSEATWIIPTSGTTGEPKLVEHSFETLTRTVRTDPEKGKGLVWGLVYELARFAGIQVFFQAILGGSRLVFAPRHADAETMSSELASAGCNALSATPTLWRRLLMAPSVDKLPLRRATLGGEIADKAVLKLITNRFPSARVTHVYASTEAGVGFSVTDGLAGFPASFLETPPSGVELNVDEDGTLWLRPAIQGQRFVGIDQTLSDTDGWINSGDRVRREEDRFYFLGRANGAINVGGNKVYPEEIEDCIRGVSGVRQVGVRARANPLVGSLVEALVQPEPNADKALLKKSITQTCRENLAPFKVPALITWTEELAVSAAGKLLRS